MVYDKEFYLRAAQLARTSPEAWNNFLGEVQRVADKTKDQVLDVPLDVLQSSRGYALAHRDLYVALQQCKEQSDKIQSFKRYGTL